MGGKKALPRAKRKKGVALHQTKKGRGRRDSRAKEEVYFPVLAREERPYFSKPKS